MFTGDSPSVRPDIEMSGTLGLFEKDQSLILRTQYNQESGKEVNKLTIGMTWKYDTHSETPSTVF